MRFPQLQLRQFLRRQFRRWGEKLRRIAEDQAKKSAVKADRLLLKPKS